MAKVYRVVITAIDSETNTETVEVDNKFTGLTLVADHVGDEGRMAEIVLLAAGSKTSVAVRLAAMLMDLEAQDLGKKEDALLRSIMEDM